MLNPSPSPVAKYFLKHKSEAPARIRNFVSKLNAICSAGKAEPVRIVGQLQLDNAGEFLSNEFSEFLDESSIARTTFRRMCISSTVLPNEPSVRSWR